jgi:hypothetical protein
VRTVDGGGVVELEKVGSRVCCVEVSVGYYEQVPAGSMLRRKKNLAWSRSHIVQEILE